MRYFNNLTEKNILIDQAKYDNGIYTFKNKLDKDSYLFLEHSINGNFILPASVYIEMIHEASNFILNNNSHIKNFTGLMWLSPIGIIQISKYIVLTISSSLDDSYRVEINTEPSNTIKKSSRHMIGRWNLGLNINLNELKIDFKKNIEKKLITSTKKYIYGQFKKNGFLYGPGFQTLELFKCNDEIAISEMVYPEHLNDFDLFVMHPSLLDGAIQTTIYFLISKLKNNYIYLPFSLGRITFHSSLRSQSNFIIYTKINIKGIYTDAPKFDIYILNNSYEVLVSLSNFTLKKITR
ncbi:polyketide synthase dehydratase domain-containing protein [Gammaproteobacteria bacterium]|nr:polyketide synthase dehydratase domain-containing protein [Gammaproteobacteria bacterium]